MQIGSTKFCCRRADGGESTRAADRNRQKGVWQQGLRSDEEAGARRRRKRRRDGEGDFRATGKKRREGEREEAEGRVVFFGKGRGNEKSAGRAFRATRKHAAKIARHELRGGFYASDWPVVDAAYLRTQPRRSSELRLGGCWPRLHVTLTTERGLRYASSTLY